MSDDDIGRGEDGLPLNPGSAGKFVWGEGDVQVYATEDAWKRAMLQQEIARVDQILRECGVDPDDPEATLGNLDEDEDQ